VANIAKSPSEALLWETGTLELFPDRTRQAFPNAVTRAGVDATPALRVLVVLRDVRDASYPASERTAWLDRAHELARGLGEHEWFDIFLALMRHDVLLGNVERARSEAMRLHGLMLAKPSVEITSQSSRLRDALHRAVVTLRIPILGATIGLPLPELVPSIVEAARSDRTTDDIGRLDPLGFVAMGLVTVAAEARPVIELLVQAVNEPTLANSPARRAEYGPLYWTLARLANDEAAATAIAAACKLPVKPGKPTKRTARMIDDAVRRLSKPYIAELSPRYLADAVWPWGRPTVPPTWDDDDDAATLAILDAHIARQRPT
jgi:hypothetical protein